MNVGTLLDELHSLGVTLEARGDRLRFRPVRAVPPDLVERLRANKDEVLAHLERQAASDKTPTTLEALSQIGAVLIRSDKFGSVWLAIDQATADEIRAEECQRAEPRPILMANDVARLAIKSEKAIRGALEIIRAFPGARVIH